MTFTSVRKVSAYESIVDQIEHAVGSGELKPGDRLPGERQLMNDFSVSRATVREALRVLQATGTIESRPGDPRGPVITHYSPRVLERSMLRLAQLQSVSRIELLQFRLLLEGNACMLAAMNRSDEDMELVERCGLDLRELVDGDVSQFAERVGRLHATVRKACGNQLIEVCGDVVSGIMLNLVEQRFATDPDREARVRQSARDADDLVDAIRRKAPRDAYRTSVTSIYRFYADDLEPGEREALAAFVSLED